MAAIQLKLDGSAQYPGGELTPDIGLRLWPPGLDGHMVGARVEVGAYPGRDGFRVAPGDDRVDETIAAFPVEVVVGEAEPA